MNNVRMMRYHTRTRTMGSIEVYDAKQEKWVPYVPDLNSDVDQDTFEEVTKHNSQEVSPFPAGDHKATRNRHESTTHTNMKHN